MKNKHNRRNKRIIKKSDYVMKDGRFYHASTKKEIKHDSLLEFLVQDLFKEHDCLDGE